MDLISHTYEVDGVQLTGFLAIGVARRSAPGILLAHEAPGITELIRTRAAVLPERGYIVFALDMYGQENLSLDEAREQSHRLMVVRGSCVAEPERLLMSWLPNLLATPPGLLQSDFVLAVWLPLSSRAIDRQSGALSVSIPR
jgi:dienelactone hydrolase